jgi:adenylosuccinate lyase
MANQCVPYTREAQHLRTVRTLNEQILKLAGDFRFLVSCPGQFFVKKLVAGRKGSSSNPGKTNMWMTEGAMKLLRKANVLLEFVARELQDYTCEGDMGRSVILRDIGSDVAPIFIALDRMKREMNGCVPNPANIHAFIEKYPALSMTAMQYVLKRERYRGDAYRAIQGMVINPDGSYATRSQFMPRFRTFTKKAGFSARVERELLSHMDPVNLVRPIHEEALREMTRLRGRIQRLRRIQGYTPSLRDYHIRTAKKQ